jgi:hypothetical protein
MFLDMEKVLFKFEIATNFSSPNIKIDVKQLFIYQCCIGEILSQTHKFLIPAD